jgi:enoyl-[acyl-carrier protein] reductase/trans-2-enoyl-CoA reductase (NAD+)
VAERLVESRGKGVLLLDSHPTGCERTVQLAADEIAAPADSTAPPPTALVIGSSAGYGAAITIAGLIGLRLRGLGLALERPPGRLTASAGWYRTAEMARVADSVRADFEFHNADCFADATKTQILDRLAERFGALDYLIYSVAAPRRTDPSGTTYQSVIKPLGEATTTWSLDFEGGAGRVRRVEIQPGSPEETEATVKVMGGEDWADWVAALDARGLLNPGFQTVALSYIGSDLTSPIYRDGTIGAAKHHLEQTARELTESLKARDGRALTSVNGAAVTQASTAIPGISLYVSLLHSVLGDALQSPARQGQRLWGHLTGTQPLEIDAEGRIRLDDWEFAEGVQDQVRARWAEAVEAGELAPDVYEWFMDEVRRLYGFSVPGVDYTQPVEVDIPWPKLH